MTRDDILRAVHELQHGTTAGVARNSAIAARIGIRPPSVTGWIRKLAECGLVRYLSRDGVTLTDEGNRLAVASIKQVQLIEQFLSQELHISPEYAAEEAPRIARFVSERVMGAIAQHLCDAAEPPP